MDKDCSKKKIIKAMTVKKYTRSLLEYVLKRYKIKNMQVSLRSNCFAHRYFKA